MGIAKGTTPIIGVTKKEQVLDAAKASHLELTDEEVNELEQAAKNSAVDMRGS